MTITRSDRNGIATLTLDRPEKLNSLTIRMFETLLGHVEDIARSSDSIGVVLLRGAGRCFCAGNDIRGIVADVQPSRPDLQAYTIARLAELPQPVVAAVHGYCFTGGLELALGADIILASADARFADTHAHWGLTPKWGMSQRLPRRVGRAKASEMMFAGRRHSGEEAVAMGLANRCFPDAAFDREVDAFVRDVAEQSWPSLRHAKRLLRETQDMTLAQGLAHEFATHPGVDTETAARLATFTGKSDRSEN